MVAWKWCSLGVALLAVACDVEQSEAVAGGSTEDFNGNPGARACASSSEVSLDEVSPMGFAPREALNLIEGTYAMDVTWLHPCSSGLECGNLSCGDGGLSFVATPLTGTETVLRVEIQATGADAVVRYAEAGVTELDCTESTDVPVQVRMATDDGALDEQWEGQLRAWNAEEAIFFVKRSVTQMDGTLANLEADSIEINLMANQTAEGIRFTTDILVAGESGYSESPILRAFLTDAEGCSHDMPRDSVLQP
ncbi:MAG TPA: hypothetical protein VHO25_19115 [Polyangiaceae bacterium]|nr:hypothetical protein [Polyangiaceae bacterium]